MKSKIFIKKIYGPTQENDYTERRKTLCRDPHPRQAVHEDREPVVTIN